MAGGPLIRSLPGALGSRRLLANQEAPQYASVKWATMTFTLIRHASLWVTLASVCFSTFAQSAANPKQGTDSNAAGSAEMEITIFARFHALEGKEEALASELRSTVRRVRPEPGCLSIEVYRSVRDARLFFLHARWVDEAAFDRHADLPATNQFVERVERLIDHPLDVNRTHLLR